MINQAYPSLNDVEPSWADIVTTFTVLGGSLIPMEAIKAVKWSRKVEVGVRRGASGGRVMARTTGQSEYEASATLYRSGVDQLLLGLMSKAPTRGNQVVISLVAFDMLIQHTPPGSSKVYTTKIKGCRYLGDADDMKEGSDADTVEITLNPIEIARIINGKEVVML